jgi:hypothetical protein
VAVAGLDKVGHLLAHQEVAAAVLVGADAAAEGAEQLLGALDRIGGEELRHLGVLQKEGRRAERDDLRRGGGCRV